MSASIPLYAGERLAQWLRDALLGKAVEHLPVVERASVPTQLQQLSFTDDDFAQRLRDALSIAVIRWQPPHGLALLAAFARCATNVKATNVVASLDTILRSGRIDPFLGLADQQEPIKLVISSISSFATLPAARASLQNLFVDRRFRTRFPSMLVTGLVRSDSENYPGYVEELLKMASDGEIKVNLFNITREIVRLAGPATIVSGLPRLRDPWHIRFCELLGGDRLSPGRWISRDAYVLQLAPERYEPVEYVPADTNRTNDIVTIIDRRMENEGGIRGLMQRLNPRTKADAASTR